MSMSTTPQSELNPTPAPFQMPLPDRYAPPVQSAAAPQERRLRFHGEGLTLLGMLIVNTILTYITLGIYYCWAKAKLRRYMFSQIELEGDRFAWHGTGKEMFLAWIKLVGLCFLAMLFFGGVMAATRQYPGMQIVLMMMLYVGILVVIPFAIVGARRYLLSRLSWRSIRFSFRGLGEEFVGPFFKGVLLSALTLGFYSPYFESYVYGYMINNTYYGTRRFSYDGHGDGLFKSYVKAFFLGLVTLGIYWFWYAAERSRYFAAHTRCGELRFESTVTGGKVFGLVFTNILLLLFTAGLATPWVIVRTVNFQFENMILRGPLDTDAVRQEIRTASAMGDTLADALDLDAGFDAGLT
jgi:uncharacterized membrane protein YjgN (DUF898 family)